MCIYAQAYYVYIMYMSMFFSYFAEYKSEISKNLVFCSHSTILQNLRLKIFRKVLIFFEHRANLQELIWITHPRNSGFVRFRFVNHFQSLLLFNVFSTSMGTWIFDISFKEHFCMNYSFTKQCGESKKDLSQFNRLYTFVWRLKWVLKDCYIVMRCFKKPLLLLLEKLRMRNSILVHEIID